MKLSLALISLAAAVSCAATKAQTAQDWAAVEHLKHHPKIILETAPIAPMSTPTYTQCVLDSVAADSLTCRVAPGHGQPLVFTKDKLIAVYRDPETHRLATVGGYVSVGALVLLLSGNVGPALLIGLAEGAVALYVVISHTVNGAFGITPPPKAWKMIYEHPAP